VDVEAALTTYGLAAVFVVMLLKSAGLPFPIPADVIMLATAARAAQGKIPLWQAFAALWLALVLGGAVQFALARGPARRVVYRFERILGLPPSRLDRASAKLAKAGVLGVGVAVLTPACGQRWWLSAVWLGSRPALSCPASSWAAWRSCACISRWLSPARRCFPRS
jgi:membrane protein DedA with SNARE-associated domain